MAEKKGNLYMIPSMPFGRDVREVEGGEWMTLLTTLKCCGLYEVIYVEIAEGLQGLMDMLMLFDEIFMYTDTEAMEVEKQFRANMRKLGYFSILDAVEKGGMTIVNKNID